MPAAAKRHCISILRAADPPRRAFLILSKAINCCWFAFKWGLAMAAVAGAVAAFCLYRQVNSEIRRRVETRLAEHYPGLKVKLRAAQLVEGKGIRVFDLSISDPNVEGPSGELLHIEEALFECSTDWQELIKGDPQVRRVLVRRSTLRVARLPDGTWSASKCCRRPISATSRPRCRSKTARSRSAIP